MSQSDYINIKKQAVFISTPILTQLSPTEYLQNKKYSHETQLKLNTVITCNQLIQNDYVRIFGCEIQYSNIAGCASKSGELLCSTSNRRKKYNQVINKDLFIDCTKKNICKPPPFLKNQAKKDCIIPNHHLR